MRMTGATVLAFGASLPWQTARAEEVSRLRDAAAGAGILYGADSDSNIFHQPPEYGRLFAQQCSLYACTLSWKRLMPQPGLSQPAWEDPNIAFARSSQMRLTGGHLLWEENDPDWLKTTIAEYTPEGPKLSYEAVDISLIKPRLRNYAVDKEDSVAETKKPAAATNGRSPVEATKPEKVGAI